MISSEKDFYVNYYMRQAGGGSIDQFYDAPLYQQGYGIGNFFARLYKSVLPYLKIGAKKIGKQFLNSSANVINDMNSNQMGFKHAVQKESKTYLKKLTGNGYKASRYQHNIHFASKSPTVKKTISRIVKKTDKKRKSQQVENNKKVKKSKKEKDIFG